MEATTSEDRRRSDHLSDLLAFRMRIEAQFSDRFYRLFERGVVALESIAQTLQPPPEDFSAEDQTVIDARRNLEAAIERVPHGAETQTGGNQ